MKNLQKTIRDNFLRMVRGYPNSNALWVNGTVYNYKQLYEKSMLIATQLEMSKSNRCIIICKKSLGRYVAILASVLVGKSFVPVAPDSPESTLRKIFKQINTDCYLIDTNRNSLEEFIIKNNSIKVRIIHLNKTVKTSVPLEITSKFQEVAYIMFTSGSTGDPKGVEVTHQNLSHYIKTTIELFKPSSCDRFAQINDYTFDLSMHDIFVAWSVGACVYAFPTETPYRYVSYIQKHQITFWLSVPSTGISLNELKLLKKDSMPSLKCTLFCGEALPNRLVQAWHLAAQNTLVYNIYGPTECTIAITYFLCERGEKQSKIVPIGWPYSDNVMLVVDDNSLPVKKGDKGQLIISGIQVTKGYFNNSNQTCKNYISRDNLNDKWYKTGDLVIYSDKYGFEYKGRIDDQMKIRGFRIERLEIETLLREASKTDAVAVVGWPVSDTSLYKGIVAFIDEKKQNLNEIRTAYQALMPEYMWPSRIYFQKLPKNKANKIDYNKLKELLLGNKI